MPRRSRTAKAATIATAPSTMTQRSPAAPPDELNQPNWVKIACIELTLSLTYPMELVRF